ncbi:serine/threonine-protein kinase [Myxococcaceae bacterium GXIMD 01537]
MSPRQLPLVPPGTDVGGYTVEEKLGAGGFGAVYLARRGEWRYALKLIPLAALGEWAEREVAILLRLKHPNLVRIRGHGQSLPFFFIAMDYVKGRRLDVWAQEENPSARAVVHKVLGVARGLGVAHETRVVHRDLKESNIVVRASDGEAVLVDFGAGGYESAPTITGGVLPPGTPEYRAPEAWRFLREHGDTPGASYQPGPSDDLYALGVVLYWLLTGRQPFQPDEAAGVEAVLHRAPTAPHALNPRVPGTLGDVCLRLLAKWPEERHPSAQALSAELESLLAQADASWDVSLCDAYGPDTATTLAEGPLGNDEEVARWVNQARARPRRGPRPPRAEDEQENAVHEPAVEAALAVRTPDAGAVRAAAGVCILLLAVGALVSTRHSWPAPAPEHRAPEVPAPSSAASPGLSRPPGDSLQELATPWRPPEALEATDPLKAAYTAAAVAARATFTKDTPSVMMKKNTGVPPQPQQQPSESGSLGKALSLGIAACMGLACPGPQVRPAPKPAPEDCPPGAITAMDKLGIKKHAWAPADFLGATNYRDGRVMPVHTGATTLVLVNPLGKLPGGWVTELRGKLFVGETRIYARLTEARTSQGESIPVCIQLVAGNRYTPGVEKLSDGGPDTSSLNPFVDVRAVHRFE